MTAKQRLTGDPEAFARFGDLLRFLRLRAQITQRDLSIAVGYNFGQISRLEQGQRLPDPAVIAAVFVPALDLAGEPAWAQRLVALAEDARSDRRAAAVSPAAAPPADRAAPAALAATPQTPQPLLATKLFVPRARPNLVERPRLLAQLDSALQAPLSVIAAPAGFGKTTLLAAWLANVERKTQNVERINDEQRDPALRSMFYGLHFSWLALDDGDNDPATFLRYLIAALQTVAPAIGATALAMLQSPQSPAPDVLVRLVLNDLAALPHDTIVVLDDYHLVTTPAIHAALAVLVEHAPPTLHLVIATRADPSLPLARLRARGLLVELRAADLRFTPDEAATFLTTVMGLPLSAADVAALDARTEGWVAGLQLAALAMRNRGDLEGFISAFTGSNRFVVDYLAAEVFARQPPHIQAFLLQTSVLERLCGPLCDAVMGVADNAPHPQAAYTQTLLEELERANLFLVPLDDERRWYRYHHLFGAMLRERLLSGASSAEVASLHGRASAWFAAQGLIEEAIQQAVLARDWGVAVQLIEEHGLLLMMRGQLHTGLGWLNALPAAAIRQRPLVCILYAIGLMLINEVDGVEAHLRDAEQSLQPDTPDELARVVRGSVAGIRGRMHYFAGDMAQAIRSITHALALLPETTTSVAAGRIAAMARGAWTVYVATAYQLTGDVSAASERRLGDAIGPVRALGHLMAALTGYTSLASLQALQGRLRTVAATYAEVDRLVPGQDALHSLVGSPAYYFGVGNLLRERNALDDAARYLARGMELVQGALATEGEVLTLGYLALARVQHARGDSALALGTLQAFAQVARERRLFRLLTERAAAMQARIQLMQGDLPAAMRWADASGLHPDDELSFAREALDLTLARVRIAAGQAQTILPLLDRLAADAEAKARMHSAIEILALHALAHHALGDAPRALVALAQALTLAEPEGYVRIFVDEGAPLATLLQIMSHGLYEHDTYVQQLLAAFGSAERAAPSVPAQGAVHRSSAIIQPLVEPLTDRELEVLRLVAVGQTNRAISAALVIEAGTVKRHIHSLLGKLGAANRTEAVARARALRLI